jgi:hypothetical protein
MEARARLSATPLLAVVNGALVGVGGVYLDTYSVALVVIAAARGSAAGCPDSSRWDGRRGG